MVCFDGVCETVLNDFCSVCISFDGDMGGDIGLGRSFGCLFSFVDGLEWDELEGEAREEWDGGERRVERHVVGERVSCVFMSMSVQSLHLLVFSFFRFLPQFASEAV